MKLLLFSVSVFYLIISFGFTFLNNQTGTLNPFYLSLLNSTDSNALSENLNSETNNSVLQQLQLNSGNYQISDFITFADTLDSLSNNQFFTDPFTSDSVGLIQDTAVTPIDKDSLDRLRRDSLFMFQNMPEEQDTGSVIDTNKIRIQSQDSTARLKYFRYDRKDNPVVKLYPKKRSKFFAQPSQGLIERKVEIDSTGNFVIVKQLVAGKPAKIILQIPLNEYIDLVLNSHNRDIWEQLAYQYELKEQKDDLSKLITDITNIDIPLPSAGFLSIFGPPKINLKIGGAVDIHGAWRNETTDGVTASLLGNTRNEPDFKQQVQITVDGTIGDKLKIGADWNTERTFEYENQLKLKYTGYEDEIVQSVEAGNVSLQTSPLVGGSEALFGIKANFQMGPLSLTTLASQKKGEVKEVSVTGGSSSQPFEIRAWNYSKNHYFIHKDYADTVNLNLFFNYYANPSPVVFEDYFVDEDIQVWKSFTGTKNTANQRDANAYYDLPERSGSSIYGESLRNGTAGGVVESGRFVLLTYGVDYTMNKYTGSISFNTPIQEDDIVAVAFRRGDGKVFGEFSNEIDDSSRIVLNLVKPKHLLPSHPAWQLQLKNIYSLNARNIKNEGFELDIFYKQEGQEPANNIQGNDLLALFGLDRFDQNKNAGKDGKFDWSPGRTILPATGEIIFPVLQPFGANLPAVLDTSLRYQTIYNNTQTIARQDIIKDKYSITGKYSGESSSTFNIGFNVVEGSVKVRLNGRELQPRIDYTVDYMIGQIIIRNDDALAPGADLRITYEQNDLFQLASKTLVGARGEMNFSKRTNFGFSFLNLSQQTLSDKVRIGEEPLSNSIFGLDFKTGVDLPFITRGINKIISTKAPSSFNVAGEFAYIMPDPNTKRSTVASDFNKSIAYIDDFEGSKRTIPIGISYTSWRDISIPDPDRARDLNYLSQKAKAYWYNYLPSNVFVRDIWGESKKVAKGDEAITVLDFVFMPNIRGYYNYTPQLDTVEQNWGGMMKGLSSSASNLDEEKVEFIEFWINVISPVNPDAKIYLDLGRISEDVLITSNIYPDTEDKNDNGLIDEGEDVGLDGVADASEPGFSAANPDPANDNFNLVPGFDYRNANGTEGNATLSDVGRFPDTEDLNRNNTLDVVNSFFRYTVPLDTNRATNPYITGGGAGSQKWYQIRIPIRDSSLYQSFGTPNLSAVENIRVWVDGFTDTLHLRFAEFNFVGSQWEKVFPKVAGGGVNNQDTVLVLSVINKEDNPGEYYSPPGIVPEIDRTNPQGEFERNEQSLLLRINNLEDGDERQVFKVLPRQLDVFSYREMKMFIWGDLNTSPNSISVPPNLDSNYNSEVYFRFGADTLNFYEYRMPLFPDWQEISINFEELTSIKQARVNDSLFYSDVSGKPGHKYGIKGRPALTNISFFMVGIKNPRGKGNLNPVSGDVWVNELRVIGADDTKGWAYSSSANLVLADLLRINFNMSQTDPFFHRLADRFGSRVDSRNWAVAMDFDVMKVLPVDLPGSNLRVNYSRSEQVGKPLYIPGTDIKVESAALQEEEKNKDQFGELEARRRAQEFRTNTQILNKSETWSVPGVKFRVPSKKWYVRETINNLTFSFNYNQSSGRSPTVETSNRWVWNAVVDYGLSLGQKNFLYPANVPGIGNVVKVFSDYKNVKVYYLPQTFTTNLSLNRNYSYNLSRGLNVQPNIARDFTAVRNADLKWKLTEGGFLNLDMSYNFNLSSSLTYLIENVIGYQQNGREIKTGRADSEIWGDIFSGDFFGRSFRYNQNFALNSNPKLPTLWGLNKFLTLTASYSSGYSWSNDFAQADLGRSASFSNRINIGTTLKLKSLLGPLFESKTEKKDDQTKVQPNQRGRDRGPGRDPQPNVNNRPVIREPQVQNDSLNIPTDTSAVTFAQDSTVKRSKGESLKRIYGSLKGGFRWLLVDYESIRLGFSQDNSVSRGALRGGGTGLVNFWNVTQSYSNGPSRMFMLGLTHDAGPKALATGTVNDNFTQRNNITLNTNRPLWEGAQIDVNWKVGWGISKTSTIGLSPTGINRVVSTSTNGNLDRSFVSIPKIFFLPFLNSGIDKVKELYNPQQDNLAEAFVEGFESMPLLSKLPVLKEFAQYIPRPNWSLTWDGLEKISFFKSFANRVSLNHAYTSNYSEGWRLSQTGNRDVQSQKIAYGFQPLVGLNLGFKPLWKGNLSGNIRYSTTTGYDLGLTTKRISESFSKEIGFTAAFSKAGLEVPLFGIYLKNDVEFSLSYSNSKNTTVIYDMSKKNEAGTPQDGTARTTLEPRVKMVVSSKVTASIFYRRSSLKPEGAARIQGSTTNEYGLDVRITIQ